MKTGILAAENLIKNYTISLLYKDNIPIFIITVNRSEDQEVVEKVINLFRKKRSRNSSSYTGS